jgi:hypothetical protein
MKGVKSKMGKIRNVNYELAWHELKDTFIHQIESPENKGMVHIEDLQRLMDELEHDYEV